MMRITLNIDDSVADQLMRITGEKSHASAIRHALNAYLAAMRKQQLLALRGQVQIDDTWQELRQLDVAE